MATLNLGRLKPVFRSTWNSSTAYNVDDIVVRNNQSYISIQAGTNQDPATATAYWTLMAAKGSDGTDVGATLTTQGDVLYRDGSGIQRLAAGTAGHVLQTGGAGANPSWTAVSSDLVKLAHVDMTSEASYVESTGWVDDTTYACYLIRVNNLRFQTGSGDVNFRFTISGGVDSTNNFMSMDGMYYSAGNTNYQRRTYWNDGAINDFEGTWSNKHSSATDGKTDFFDATLYSPSTGYAKMIYAYGTWHDNSSNTFNIVNGVYAKYNTNPVTGIRIYKSSGTNTRTGTISVYGLKK